MMKRKMENSNENSQKIILGKRKRAYVKKSADEENLKLSKYKQKQMEK